MTYLKLYLLIAIALIYSIPGTSQLIYYNADQFPLYGNATSASATRYERLPDSLRNIIRPELWELSQNSAGMAIRFRSNSPIIAAKWSVQLNRNMSHMTPVGIKGLDLYCFNENNWVFVNSGQPQGKTNKAVIIENMDHTYREYMLYLPLYDGITSLEIGIDSLSEIGQPILQFPAKEKPVVFYGTSILQGACASRPGMAHTNIISRKLNRECINLGFSGNARLDLEVAHVIANIDAGCFVLDFVPNASVEQMNERAYHFYSIIREKHPTTPIIFTEDPIFTHTYLDNRLANEVKERNQTIRKLFNEWRENGENNIYFVPSNNMIGHDREATVDGVHFTDVGMMRYTELMYPHIIKVLDSPHQPIINQKLKKHPRILFSAEHEAAIHQRLANNQLIDSLYDALILVADEILDLPPQAYKLHPQYNQMLYISREQIRRMVPLAMAYRLTKKHKYLSKIEKEIINVCSYPDWNPNHFLDTAEMTVAVSIVYDWLFYDLSSDIKELIKKSIKEKALDYALCEYNRPDIDSWKNRDTNWNVVCNTGMLIGALAIASDYPEIIDTILPYVIKYVPNCLQHMAPDGVCYEGPAYWEYTNLYLALLLQTLNMNYHTDFGLSQLPGISKSAQFYMQTTSPAGHPFIFADAKEMKPYCGPIYFFYSDHFTQPDVATYNRTLLSKTIARKEFVDYFFFLSLPWFDDSTSILDESDSRLKVYKGINDIAIFKGDKSKPNAIYMATKAGEPARAHQHMDVGTFNIEANNIVWGIDLGSENYALPGFWDNKKQRWSYFRNNNRSHNTLVIGDSLQSWKGKAQIIDYSENADEPFVTIDMSELYPHVKSVFRTFTMINDTTMEVTDSIKMNQDNSYITTWNMMTDANIKLIQNKAILNKDGKKFQLEILSPANAKFIITKPPKQLLGEFPISQKIKHLQVEIAHQNQQGITIRMTSI